MSEPTILAELLQATTGALEKNLSTIETLQKQTNELFRELQAVQQNASGNFVGNRVSSNTARSATGEKTPEVSVYRQDSDTSSQVATGSIFMEEEVSRTFSYTNSHPRSTTQPGVRHSVVSPLAYLESNRSTESDLRASDQDFGSIFFDEDEVDVEAGIELDDLDVVDEDHEDLIQAAPAPIPAPQPQPQPPSPVTAATGPQTKTPAAGADAVNGVVEEVRKAMTIGIHPHSEVRTYWDLIMSLAYWYILYVVPVSSSFDKSPLYDTRRESIVLACFSIVDTLLNCFTLHIKPRSHKVLSLPTSFRKYVTSLTFWIDLITIPAFDILLYDKLPMNDAATFTLLRLLRVACHFPGILEHNPIYERLFKAFQNAFGINPSVIKILKFALILLWFLHLNACLTFLFGRLTRYALSSWSGELWVIPKPVWQQYSWSFLMAVGNSWPFTMDLRPHEVSEVWVHAIFVFCGALLTGALTGLIQSVRVDMDPPGRLYKEKLDQVNEYMASKNLDERIRRSVREYYRLKFHGRIFDEKAIYDELNLWLRQQMAAGTMHAFLTAVPFLRTDDEKFLGSLALSLDDRFYMPDATVYGQGTLGDDMFFIASGSVSIIVDGRNIGVLTSGDYFGEMSLLVDMPRNHSIKTTAACHLYRLDRNEYCKILEDFPHMAKLAEEEAMALVEESEYVA